MTCIVAMRKGNTIVMGGDRSINYNDHRIEISSIPKIKKLDENTMIGISGRWRDASTILEYLEVPPNIPKYNNNSYILREFIPELQRILKVHGVISKDEIDTMSCDDSFLVVYNGQIYYIGSYFDVVPTNCLFSAIGSGTAYALGSLYATEKLNVNLNDQIRMALEVAEHYDGCVKGPFDFLEVKCSNV